MIDITFCVFRFKHLIGVRNDMEEIFAVFMSIKTYYFGNYSSYLKDYPPLTRLRDSMNFECSWDSFVSERKYFEDRKGLNDRIDIAWHDYLKSIGGIDNMKPAGVFPPSRDLRSLVRSGVPAAFRPFIWQRISLSSNCKVYYGEDYYFTLRRRLTLQEQRTNIIIKAKKITTIKEETEEDLDEDDVTTRVSRFFSSIQI